MLYGLIKRVQRLAQAYMRLRRLGFGSEGEVLVRSALEHSATAQYAYLTPDGVQRLNATLLAKQREWAITIAESSSVPKMREWADSLDEPVGPGLPPFSGDGIIGTLDTVKFLKTTYKVLSQVGHVSHEAWTDTFEDVDGKLHIRDQPEPSWEHEIVYSLAGFCMLSAWVLARLEGDDAEIDRLHHFGNELHLPWRLDLHLPREKRRFPDDEI
ncbi:hypothetical protein [Agromyces bauzanensis]